MAGAFNKSDIEILVSTMDRENLDFLEPMFPFTHFSNLNVLIVNQTTEGKELLSSYNNIRVVNSFEKGLSKSRNLAVVNAKHKIGIVADDDLVFLEGFDEKVTKGFNHFPDATAIKFITVSFEGRPFRKYPEMPLSELSDLQLLNSSSVEMVFNVEKLRSSGKRFNENFGLGAFFPLGEEPILLNELHHSGWQVSHFPETIVSHSEDNNSGNISLMENYRIRGAYLAQIFGNKFPMWLFIQLAYNLKSGKVKPWQVLACIKSAVKGKKQLKQIYEDNA